MATGFRLQVRMLNAVQADALALPFPDQLRLVRAIAQSVHDDCFSADYEREYANEMQATVDGWLSMIEATDAPRPPMVCGPDGRDWSGVGA